MKFVQQRVAKRNLFWPSARSVRIRTGFSLESPLSAFMPFVALVKNHHKRPNAAYETQSHTLPFE
jgi:hypothetical protein